MKQKIIALLIPVCIGSIFNTSASSSKEITRNDVGVISSNRISFLDKDTLLGSTDRFEELPEDSVPVFDNSDYRRRLEILNKRTTIELDYNNYVQAYINLYTIRKREQVSKMLILKEYYYPVFEKVFREMGIPEEMKHLAMVESALNPFAISRVGATGIWQFMYATGKLYKLNVDTYEDERRDPLKATYAAAQYFKNMYEKYGDWLLVIASYNCGPGNVNKAIRRAGGVKDFWVIRKYLPAETRGYVPAFIAVNYVMNHCEVHNIRSIEPLFSHKNDTVELNSMVSFERLANSIGIPMQDIKNLNPLYKRGIVMASSENPKKVVIPSSLARQFAKVKDSLLINQPPITIVQYNEYAKPIYHYIKSGETVSTIASRYGVSMADLKSWNKLTSNMIYAGHSLKIYKSEPQKMVLYAEASQHTEDDLEDHLDEQRTTETIALKNNGNATSTTQTAANTTLQNKVLTIQQLEEKKPLSRNPSTINVDASEKVISNASATKVVNMSSGSYNASKTLAEVGKTIIDYKVKYGDTLYLISKRYGTTVDVLMKQNGITNPRALKAGALIKVQTLKG